jgi:hypothetical protein
MTQPNFFVNNGNGNINNNNKGSLMRNVQSVSSFYPASATTASFKCISSAQKLHQN